MPDTNGSQLNQSLSAKRSALAESERSSVLIAAQAPATGAKLAAARVLDRQPKVLIMGEGAAHLDAQHQQVVKAAIAAMGIARIIIAHRQERIAPAERVVIMVADNSTTFRICWRHRSRSFPASPERKDQ